MLKNLHIKNPGLGSPQQNGISDFGLSDKVEMNEKMACSLAK